MKIAVIGSGNVGKALGLGWIRAGHEVIFAVRNPASPKVIELLELTPGAQVMAINEAVKWSEIVVVGTPAHVVPELFASLDDIGDRMIIDSTNAVRNKPEPFRTALEAIKAITHSNKVVKCFNTTGFENMLNPHYPQTAIDMFVAGNDKASKAIATQLALDLGFASCLDFGGDDKVELLEQLALCWINLAIMQGHGRGIAFKVLQR
jgi:hypothetical protein